MSSSLSTPAAVIGQSPTAEGPWESEALRVLGIGIAIYVSIGGYFLVTSPGYRSPLTYTLEVALPFIVILLWTIGGRLDARAGLGSKALEHKRRVFALAPGLEGLPCPPEQEIWEGRPLRVLLPRVCVAAPGCGEETEVEFVADTYQWCPDDYERSREGSNWEICEATGGEVKRISGGMPAQEIEAAWQDFIKKVAEINRGRYRAIRRANYQSHLTNLVDVERGPLAGDEKAFLWLLFAICLSLVAISSPVLLPGQASLGRWVLSGIFASLGMLGIAIMAYHLPSMHRFHRPDSVRTRFDLTPGLSNYPLAHPGTASLFPAKVKEEHIRFVSEEWIWRGEYWAFAGLSNFEPPLPIEFALTTDDQEIERAWDAYQDAVAHENRCLQDSFQHAKQLEERIGTLPLQIA